MKLWPFGKRRGANAPEAVVAPSAPPSTRLAAPASSASRPTGAWRDLPALRPTSSSFSLTAPVQRLSNTMTSMQKPQVTARTLGHERSTTGPTGSAGGIVRTPRVHPRSGDGRTALGFAQAPAPVPVGDAVPLRSWTNTEQHRPAVTTSRKSVSSGGGETRAIERSTIDDSAVSAALPRTQSRALPARAMPARATPLATPEPVASRSSAAPAFATPASDSPVEPTVGATGSSRQISRSIEPSVQRADAPTVGTSRVVRRIGQAMQSRPASMVDAAAVVASTGADGAGIEPAQRLPDLVRPAPPAPGALPMNAARSLAVASADAGAPDSRATRASRSQAALSRTVADAPLVGESASIQRLSATPPALTAVPQRLGKSAAEEPDASDVVFARRGIQRAPESVPPDVRSELEPILGESLSDVKVHRGADTGAAARSIQAKAFTTGGEVFMPDEHGSTSSGEGRKILAHELTHVAQQRSLGGALPPENSTGGAALEAEARAVGGQGPVPVRPVERSTTLRPVAGPAQRLEGSPMPTAVRPLPAAPSGSPAPEGKEPMPMSAQAAIVARVQAAATKAGVPTSLASTAASQGAGPATIGSTSISAAGSGAHSTGGSNGHVVQRLDSQSNTASAGESRSSSSSSPTAAAGPDIDDLERQLYPRFKTRLKRDLLSDRERSGRLFDR